MEMHTNLTHPRSRPRDVSGRKYSAPIVLNEIVVENQEESALF